MNNKRVLLTGVSGFLGSHTAIRLLEKGYIVIGTIRNLERAKSIKAIIEKHTSNARNITFVEADLSSTDVWYELTKNIDFIQHIASPFPRVLPKKESELIEPAQSGTLHVLKAAAANGVKRVVMTSSIASVVYGKAKNELAATFNENTWTDETNKKDTTPYIRSKTMAEKAAWAFIKNDHSGLELTTVLPGAIFIKNDHSGLELTTVLPGAILGPVLEEDFGTSANIVIKSMDGSSPAVPKIGFDIVDVRSVADLLISAMELPQAANQRYIASSGYLTFRDVAAILKQHHPNRKVPSKELPGFFVKLLSIFDTSLKTGFSITICIHSHRHNK